MTSNGSVASARCAADAPGSESMHIASKLRWPKRAIPSFPYGRTSILPSALPYFHRRFSTNLALLCACAKCKRTTGEASTNTHEVKRWMASNRQGPIVAAATRDGLIRHYFFEGFEYRLIACFLYFVHGINISVRQIKRVLWVFNLRRKSRWNSSSIRTIRNLVLVCLIYPHVSMRDMSDCCAGRVEDFRKPARVQDDV